MDVTWGCGDPYWPEIQTKPSNASETRAKETYFTSAETEGKQDAGLVTEPHREQGKALPPVPSAHLAAKQGSATERPRSKPHGRLSQGGARSSCDSREVLRSCEEAPVAGALPPGSPHGLRGKSGSRGPPAFGHGRCRDQRGCVTSRAAPACWDTGRRRQGARAVTVPAKAPAQPRCVRV